MQTFKTTQIPELSAEQIAATQALHEYIVQQIQQAGGKIPFSQFMQLVLYAPQWGYYTGGAHKIGAAGDFITAPTLTPLFAQTLAVQILELLPQTAGNVYEFGAGTGALAADLLNALSGSLKNYYIIELSSDLAQRQNAHIQQHAPEHAHKVVWLDRLPETFDGILIGNEVLDAMPVERVRRNENGAFELAYVAVENQEFCFQYNYLDDEHLLQAACTYFPDTPDYTSELHPTQHAFIQTLAHQLTRGAMIWIDYGFDSKQYYYPQRTDGTLIGHHRHHSIHDPFYRVGLTDLTAHVNFSDIADAGCGANLDLIGYTTQANFLFNLGILDLLAAQYPRTDTPEYVQAAHVVQQLTAQHEMGELFKVMAFGKNVDVDWRGFMVGDLCHKL
ncbi:class I SAM-dependent methyltransferase [Alysiella crassa]|uniref:Uncharacterized ACR, COG1565 n=1 Tax=Alysiella crassa TaxID=153491 RepID=A0A376BNF8_9NEIS|nr:SAM-dependent methyltransferase [Alysiella crassa]UOP06720.1 SAM-dependent methyltransferase [Alysiella crassa]SSY71173.1 Uncharacterized ACR, COG1565 [Alysiella crassa]